jgi:hypothetical protein
MALGDAIPHIPEISNYRQKNIGTLLTRDQTQIPLDEKSKLYLRPLHSCQPDGKFLPSICSLTYYIQNELMTGGFGLL